MTTATPVDSTSLAAALSALVADPAQVIDTPQIVDRLSRDFYWYSPVLKKLLDGKHADVVVQPVSAEEVQRVLGYCYEHEIAVTARGSGTGNYGQAVPLEGGVVLDLQKMDQIEAIGADGIAQCQPGVRLAALETEARKSGWELRCYPSTVVKASVGGFLGGGSGGIGSIAHGGLRDFNTVRAIEIVTMEAQPRILKYEGEKVHDILHAWGTNGIITRIWLALTPAIDWAQCAIGFDTFDAAFTFAETIANSGEWTKRLITVFEWPIPSFFNPVKQVVSEGKALIFFMIAATQMEAFEELARNSGGEVTFSGPHASFKTSPLLSDYTWNHTTLWAIRNDDSYTYLQCGFDPIKVREQFAELKRRFGEEILFHIEFTKNGSGAIVPGSIPIVRFTTEERLNEMIDTCRAIGVSVANPHVNHVEGGGRYREDNVQLLAKQELDAKGLLNPGKMATFVRAAVTDGGVEVKTWIPDARNFAYLSWKQVDALDRDETLLVLPTAAIEQHGHHLPLATDTLINNYLLGKGLALLPSEMQVYALPPICYGKSNEHIGFPGTLSVSASTFMAVVRDLGASVAASGFKKLALFNTHGGNAALVDVMARDLRAEFGLRTFTLFGSGGAVFEGLNPQEKAYGFHAGELETALMLSATPELVHTDQYTVNYIAHIDKPELLKPEFSGANFAWLTRDIAESGVMGDPNPATAENGDKWAEAAAQSVAEALTAMYHYENRFRP